MSGIETRNTTVVSQRGGLSQITSNALTSAATKAGVLDRLQAARTIVIKVNLAGATRYAPESGANVGADGIAALVEALHAVNSRAAIAVAEGDSVGADAQAYRKFEALRYDRMFAGQRLVTLLDLARCPVTSVALAHRSVLGNPFVMPAPIIKCDFYISVAKIKTHNMTRVSGILKNQFGALPVTDKSAYHPFLAEVIRDVNLARPPDFGILDGAPAMEGDGPLRGQPVNLNLTLFGADPVAVDSTMAATIGIEPLSIRHLRLAAEAGLGTAQLSQINVLGLSLGVESSRRFREIPLQQRVFVDAGLCLQRVGFQFAAIGHRVHGIRSVRQFRKLPQILRRRLVRSVGGR